MPIQVLPKHVADLIAAGEVVERPASVVKELCENALDAGATALTVEIRQGGVRYIRVADNGGGIAREDARNAFLPHATSKISAAGDLEKILTLGFRGEALASVAAVAKVQLLSRTAGEAHGFCYEIAGGEELSLEDAGCPVGATLIVRDLFYNTPARMKFLRKDVTEGNFVGAALERLALSRPDVAFTFLREGKQVFQTPGDGNPGGAVRAVLGKLFYETLLGVKNTHGGVEVTGFVCEPAAARPNRNMQYFFLNGRYIKCPTASAALGEAYKHSVTAGKFPACVLYVALPPGLVDVNVHPAKTEVRFADDRPVFSAVYQAAVAVINAQCTMNNAQLSYAKPLSQPIQPPVPPIVHCSLSIVNLNDPGEFSNPLAPERDEPALIMKPIAKLQPRPVPQAAGVKVIGELFSTYFLAETGDELLLIDKHAAHERIIYERLKAEQGEARRQVLLEPLPLALSREEAAALLENKAMLEQMGFLVEEFGADAVALRECPLLLVGADLNAQAAEIAGYLLARKGDLATEALDWVFHSAACRAAVKAGDPTTPYERERFVEKLLGMPEIRHCPHGRPVIVTITKKELEKRFGRN
ncbi:MAG: DNA mismatch repair endonuclease MutL [Oscillospiraceae bacterium]|jgi:DNA mismatch repair protein MutL|nr:DNA mismatch repair endonuclease MutL [Oscillospiraceae bacterium]